MEPYPVPPYRLRGFTMAILSPLANWDELKATSTDGWITSGDWAGLAGVVSAEASGALIWAGGHNLIGDNIYIVN